MGETTATFRPGGNISLSAGVQQTSWEVRSAGVIRNEQEWATSGLVVARYAFHFQILSKFGGVVGTETSISYENANIGEGSEEARCHEGGFRPGAGFAFPSVLLGLVQNFQSDRRVMFTAQYGSSWYPWMRTCGGKGKTNQRLAAMPHVVSFGMGLDLFRSSSSAWTFGAGYRASFIQCVGTPASCEQNAAKTGDLERLDLFAKGIWLQTGMSWLVGLETQ
jgi:hypothetical protein